MKHQRTPLLLAGAAVALALAVLGLQYKPRAASEPAEATGDASSGGLAAVGRSAGERDLEVTPAGQGQGFYTAQPGDGMAGAFHLSSESSVRDARRKGENGGRVTVRGHARLRVVNGTEEELVYRLILSELVCSAADRSGNAVESSDGAFVQELAQPLLVRMDRDGTPLGLRFAPSTSHKARTWLRGFVQAFRVTVPDATLGEWGLDEVDNAGTARARYEVTERGAQELSLVRTKDSLRMREARALLRDFRSEATARASLVSRWCERVTGVRSCSAAAWYSGWAACSSAPCCSPAGWFTCRSSSTTGSRRCPTTTASTCLR